MLSTKQFDVYPETKTFVAEISELMHKSHDSFWERVYEDSIDLGITLTSHITGHATKWVVRSEACDDNPVWVLIPTLSSIKNNPKLADWEIHIIND